MRGALWRRCGWCGRVAGGAGALRQRRLVALQLLAVSRRSGRWRGGAGGVAAVGGGASSGGAGGVAVGCDIWQKKLHKKQESASPARIS